MRRAIALLLVLAGIGTMVFLGYRVLDPFASHRQHTLAAQLHRQWTPPHGVTRSSSPRGATAAPEILHVATGKPFAFIRIPAFGRRWAFTIVEGTGEAQLATGPGHVTGTALPGQPGSFAVAAHVLTAGNPFLHLKTLHAGYLVNVRTQHRLYVYRVYAKARVRDTDVKVLNPQAGRPQVITLITCDPAVLWSTPWRIIVWAALVLVTPR